MTTRSRRILIPVVAVAILLLSVLLHFQPGASTNKAEAEALHYSNLSKLQKRLLSGLVTSEMNRQSTADPRSKPQTYFPTGDDGCPQHLGSNIKVNQNCLNLTDPDLQGRAQANNETAIAVDPNNPNHLLATSNDYRRGDGTCNASYSLDAGRSWTDTAIPMEYTRGTVFGAVRQYWQSGGDPAVAWDTKGNAYFQCMVFQRGAPVASNPDLSSAVYIFRSTHNFGASWNFPGRPVIESADIKGTGLPPFEDKPYMTVDDQKGSPFQDRIYVTYTEFSADGSAYIWESFSNNYGESFSSRTLVSATSSLCVNTYGFGTVHGLCNENQFSQPFTGPDGALYVTWANYNTVQSGKENHFQMLLARSIDGGVTFSAPVLVGNYYELPDCATYQGGLDPGVACVPEKGPTTNSIFRSANYPSGAVNPKNAAQVVVTFGSYINVHSNESNGCVPAGLVLATTTPLYKGVKTPGACNNDILISVSNDGGATFTGTTTDPRKLTSVTSAHGQATSDQWWQWAAFTQDGKLAVSYYDRRYGSDETTGYSDVSLSGSDNLTKFATVRVTSGSMPPPTQFMGTFFGDYAGLTVAHDVVYPLWMDTRSPDLFLCPGTGAPGVPPALCTGVEANGVMANDQDIFTQGMPVP